MKSKRTRTQIRFEKKRLELSIILNNTQLTMPLRDYRRNEIYLKWSDQLPELLTATNKANKYSHHEKTESKIS